MAAKKLKPDGSHGGGRPLKDGQGIGPRGPQTHTRNLAKTGAEIARSHGVPLEMLCEYYNAVLAGHSSATIQQDDDGDWYVTWEDGELASTPEQKNYAAQFIAQRAYGMPAQNVHVEQEMRVSVDASSINLSGLPAAAFGALAALRQALLPAPSTEPADELPASTIDGSDVDDDPDIQDAELVEPDDSTSTDRDPDPASEPSNDE